MYSIPLDKIYDKIHAKTGLSILDIQEKVKSKLAQLSGLVSEEGAAHIIANELGVRLFEAPGLVKMSELLAGMRGIDVQGKVLRKYEKREFTTKDGRKGQVANLLLGDESGMTRLVLWNAKTQDFDASQDGDVIKVTNATVKDNNGRAEVHVNDSSIVTLNPAGVSITVQVRATGFPGPAGIASATRKYIQDLGEQDSNVALLGAIVQVFDIRFFEVCPQCNKRVRESGAGFVCPTHGTVAPAMNYVLSLILDDGTGTMRITCWKQETQQITGKSHEELLLIKENPGAFEEIKIGLLGTIVKIAGRTQKNQTFDRVEFTASGIEKNVNPEQELQALAQGKLAPAAPMPELSATVTPRSQAPQVRNAPEPTPNGNGASYFEEDI